MEAKYSDWIKELTHAKDVQKDLTKQAGEKKALLSQMAEKVQKFAEQMETQGRGLKGVQVQDTAGNKSKMLDYEDRDQSKEFDLDELKEGVGVASQADLAKVADVLNTAEMWKMELMSHKTPDGKPLFSTDDLADELFTPLVRRGILPETMVPDECSETKKMVEGSMKAYGDRLKSDELSKKHNIKEGLKEFLSSENLAIALAGISAVATTASSVGTWSHDSLAGLEARGVTPSDLSPSPDKAVSDYTKSWLDPNDPNKKLPGILEAANPGGWTQIPQNILSGGYVTNVKDVIAGPLAWSWANDAEAEPGKQPSARMIQAPRVAQACTMSLAAQLTGAMADVSGIMATAASSTFGAIVRAPEIAKSLRGDKPNEELKKTDADKAVKLIAKGFAETMKSCAAKLEDADGLKKEIIDAGASMAAEFEAKCKAEALCAVLVEKEGKLDPTGAINLLVGAGKAAVAKAATVIDKIKKDPGKVDKITEGAAAKMNEEIEAARAVTQKQIEDEAKAALEEHDSEKILGIIEKKTAELQRHAAQFQLLNGAAQMAVDQAARFFAPMAAVGSTMNLIKDSYEAVARYRDWTNFAASRQDMVKAASPYMSPAANFISNSKGQWAHYSFNALMEGLHILAAALQCTGVTLAAGAGLAAAVSTAQALEGFIREVSRKMDLRAAWKIYKLALMRPANRKVALVAMKKNPTLAKYAMAYGCLIQKDPLVADFIGACGLNEQSLRDPRGNLDRVVGYLEARLPDDIVVSGREDVTNPDWTPTKVELTVGSWARARKRGETIGEIAKVGTPALDKSLARFEMLSGALAKAPPADELAVLQEKCKDTFDSIRTNLLAYEREAIAKSGDNRQKQGSIKQMVGTFLDETRVRQKELKLGASAEAEAKIVDEVVAKFQADAESLMKEAKKAKDDGDEAKATELTLQAAAARDAAVRLGGQTKSAL